MPSIRGAQMGLCILRCGPQKGLPVIFCTRPGYNVTVSCCNSAVHQSYSRGMSAVANQKQRNWTAIDHSTEMENQRASSKRLRGFITDPSLVNIVSKCLKPSEYSRTAPVVIECNPGPGILTKALLDAGINVVALESNADFLPSLKVLQHKMDKLKVVHCDFLKLDPWFEGLVEPPAMYSSTLMKHLGIHEVPWSSDVPIKVFVMVNHKKERNLLWRQIYFLYEQLSIYKYGRIELNMFMSENLYKKLTCNPGNFTKYRALSVLYQAACDIELLHKEPMSNFLTPSKCKGSSMAKSGDVPDNNMCLVRVTPRRDLFSDRFTPASGKMFIQMVKQLLATRKSILKDRLNSFDPGNGEKLLESLSLPESIATGNIYPEEYKFLFEIMLCSEDFVFDNVYEDLACASY